MRKGKSFVVLLGESEHEFLIDGETGYGQDEVLLQKDDNLLARHPANHEGYFIADLLSKEEFLRFRAWTLAFMKDTLKEMDGQRRNDLERLSLENYHEYVTDREHALFCRALQGCLSTSIFPMDVEEFSARISELIGVPVSPEQTGRFCLRVIRPNSNDNNPPHRDVWLDHLRNAVNIYLPLAGSNPRSSLPMVRGSHFWKESEIERTLQGAKIQGVAFTVPSVTGAKRPIMMERPDPREGQVLLFSPYLIHGGGVNMNRDHTRVSIEMRFWRRGNLAKTSY